MKIKNIFELNSDRLKFRGKPRLMKPIPTLLFFGVIFLFSISCKREKVVGISGYPLHQPPNGGKPNIIFVLGDDVGYEMPTFDGGQSYNTMHLDSLAANALVFTQCNATPLCSPSRVELLSGLYNFRNYMKYGWGAYDTTYTSYAKVLQQNGYKTCVVGKWQLDGASLGIENTGFDSFCVWDESNSVWAQSHYRSPRLYANSGVLTSIMTAGQYSEDITADYAYNFIDQNKDKPFFIYYSFNLVHSPHQPTPLDARFKEPYDDINLEDTTYIGSMTHYMDIKVGALINKLKSDGLDKNTIIVFAGDNGSQADYHSRFNGQLVQGQKGLTTQYGTHVPLFVYWPGHIAPGTDNNLVDFTDFYPTFLDMAGVINRPAKVDGVSFYPQLFGNNSSARSWIYCYFDPFPLKFATFSVTNPISYAQDADYKLYKTGNKAGNFYHFTADLKEKRPLTQLTSSEVAIKQKLQAALNNYQ